MTDSDLRRGAAKPIFARIEKRDADGQSACVACLWSLAPPYVEYHLRFREDGPAAGAVTILCSDCYAGLVSRLQNEPHEPPGREMWTPREAGLTLCRAEEERIFAKLPGGGSDA